MIYKVKDIEFLRGLAVLMVIICHVPYFGNYIKPVFLQTWTGVDLFFVISGCVVSLSLLKTLPQIHGDLFDRIEAYRNPLKSFFLKRLFRITPLALLWAIIPLSCAFLFNQSGSFKTTTFFEAYNQLLGIFTLQYNYLYIFNLVPHELGHYWSLAVEEHFYIILPLFFLMLPSNAQRLRASLIFVCLITFFIRPLFPLKDVDQEIAWRWMRFASHNRFDSLFLGVILGILAHHRPKASHSNSRYPYLATGMVVLIGMLWLVPGMEITAPLWSLQITIINLICFVMVYFASLDLNLLCANQFLKQIGTFFGARSYALYLVHYPSYKLTDEIFYRLNSDQVHFKIVFFLVLTGILSELSYRLVELPFIKLGRKVIT